MIYRRAVLDDIDRLGSMALLRRVLSSGPYGMVVDEAKVRATVTRAITEGYCAIAEHDGELVAYIAALITEHPYFERLQLTVVGWYSEAHGAGLATPGFKLYRDMMKWREERPMIGAVCVVVDPDEKLHRLMVRLGAIVMPAYLIL